jgi:Zn-dependent protease/predicted transcriptional regulator
MLQGGIPIGKAFGISLRLHWSWFIIFVLITWALSTSYFPSIYPHWSLAEKVTAGIITSLFFFGSVLLHELMHSIVALHKGIHISSITLFILGGVSAMTEEPKEAKDEFLIAIAGPGTSLVLGGIFWGVWITLGGTNAAAGSNEFIAAIVFWLGYINLALGVFNLIPGFPLDGGRVLRSLIWWRTGKMQNATKIASNIGRVIGYLFILGGIYLVFTGDLFNGIWLALIGWFLESSAAGSYNLLLMQDTLKGHIAAEIMSRDCQMIPSDITLEKLVNEYIMKSGRRCFPVVFEGHVQGLISLRDVQKVPQESWGNQIVRDAMVPLDKLKSVQPDTDLNTVMQTLAQNDINQVPVVDDNNIIGMVGRDNIVNFINVRTQLKQR